MNKFSKILELLTTVTYIGYGANGNTASSFEWYRKKLIIRSQKTYKLFSRLHKWSVNLSEIKKLKWTNKLLNIWLIQPEFNSDVHFYCSRKIVFYIKNSGIIQGRSSSWLGFQPWGSAHTLHINSSVYSRTRKQYLTQHLCKNESNTAATYSLENA